MATIEREGRVVDLDAFEKLMQEKFPEIPWREPLLVTYASDAGDNASGLGCRICIAAVGMKGPDVERFPKSPADFAVHLAEMHPRPKEVADA